MSFRALGLACAFASLTVLPATADDNKIFPAEASIPDSRVVRFTSAIDKEPYFIQVSIPLWTAPKGGFPVIYILDGDFFFPMAAMTSDILIPKGVVVVSVGHGALNDKSVVNRYAPRKPRKAFVVNGDSATDAQSMLRERDFRWPVKPEHRAPAFANDLAGPATGDLDVFLQVIEKEIKPKVEAMLPINRSKQAIWGWSLGGLAVVRALFTEPSAFHSFIATSPSIWYDGGAVLDDEKHFAEQVTSGQVAPHVLITVGAQESMKNEFPKQFLDKLTPAQRAEFAPYAKMYSTWPAMVPAARELAARLKTLKGKRGYQVDFEMIANEAHLGSALVSVGRAVRLVAADQ